MDSNRFKTTINREKEVIKNIDKKNNIDFDPAKYTILFCQRQILIDNERFILLGIYEVEIDGINEQFKVKVP